MAGTLIVTVGGSPQPIITAVETLQPKRVVFICSGGKYSSAFQVIGPGKPCKILKKGEVEKELPNLVTHLNLTERFDPERDLFVVEELDDPSACYRTASDAVKSQLENTSSRDIMADYTGGTKSMSIGLGMAAIDFGVSLYVTTASDRKNLKQVQWGEFTEMVDADVIRAEREIARLLPVFLGQYDYPAAVSMFQNMLTASPRAGAIRNKIRTNLDYCRALDAWDKFDHNRAWHLLERFMGDEKGRKLGLFLKRVMASRENIDAGFHPEARIKGHGYEIIEDLVLNAGRRAQQERFDDAVARLYRALELLAQVHLKIAYGIETSEVDIQKIPDELKADYEARRNPDRGTVSLGLRDSYEFLAHFDGDELGILYTQKKGPILDNLTIRNLSIMAHGFTPVTAWEYEKMGGVFISFIETGIAAVTDAGKWKKPAQFPVGGVEC